jgi:hypothetical protein
MRRPASSTKQSDGSCRTGRHTPAWPGYASRASVGHSRKHGHIVPPGTFFAVFVRGQKRYRILPSERPVWRAFQNVTQAWPESILSGHAGFIILRPERACRDSSTASIPPDWPPVPRTLRRSP